ncbi:MAG: PIG-L deacetylase family protein, partial [Gemmatimonadota bacterium]
MNVLVVVAHPDDEVLGPGGSIARHASEGDEVTILILAAGSSVRYAEEQVRDVLAGARAASGRLGVSDVRFGELQDQRLDALPVLEVTQIVEAVLQEVRPRVVYT